MTWFVYSFCIFVAAAGNAALAWNERRRGRELGRRLSLTRRQWKELVAGGWMETEAGKTLLRFLRERRRRRMEWEIGEAISYLRNAVAMGRGGKMSTGLALEELSELQGELSPVYLRMLQYLRVNEKEKVIDFFYETVGSEMSRDFARLLIQWEEISPDMLTGALESYQKNIREVNRTRQRKRDEAISDLIYLPVIMNVMLVLINFIYVAYFIDQREMLLNMFG